MKNGILLINKPKNMTSRDVVNIIAKKLNTKKVGHTGTLDPLATGLLIICVNKATSLVELITGNDKEYIAKVKLGIQTDTYDITGKIMHEDYNYDISEELLKKTLLSFKGSYMQEVPIYSAVKVNGKKLYQYARNNEKVILPKKEVTIKEIELLDYEEGYFTFKVLVSKGTYIRSLINDIGQRMNVFMTMEELTRTKIDKYDLSMAKDLDDFDDNNIIAIEDFLPYMKIDIDDNLYKKVSNGVKLNNDYQQENVMFFYENKLVAIYKKDEKNKMCLYKLF